MESQFKRQPATGIVGRQLIQHCSRFQMKILDAFPESMELRGNSARCHANLVR